jgi:peptidoglycan glycosyltransferase
VVPPQGLPMTLNARLEQLATVFLVAFGLVALALFYWGVVRGPALSARDDNPRLVEQELRVERGRILDRNGAALAETVGEPGDFERLYDEPATPAIGYYSLRHGVAGIESSYDDVLRGGERTDWRIWWEELIHRNPVGRDVQLTLDAGLQGLANAALGEHAGSVVVLDAHTGDILVLASQPSYDANLLEEQFEQLNADERAPLVNRATQALYQPGTAIQPLLLAAGLENGLIEMNGVVDDVTGAVRVDGLAVQCAVWPYSYEPTLPDAMRYACPAAFAELGAVLGPERLGDAYSRFGLTDPLELPLAVAPATGPDLTDPEGLLAEVTGQGAFTLSPLQLAWAMTAVANEGMRPPLRLVRRIGDDETGWEVVVPASQEASQSMDSATAGVVSRAMAGALPAQMVAGDSSSRMAAHVGLAVAGPQNAYNSWFIGFAPLGAPTSVTRYVVVVLLERTDEVSVAAEIGIQMLMTANR